SGPSEPSTGSGSPGGDSGGGVISLGNDPDTRAAMDRLNRDGGGKQPPSTRAVPWVLVTPQLVGKRREWGGLDEMKQDAPAAPVQVDILSDAEEVDTIMGGWK
ncbi:MAG TPA: hypothetical protein VK943_20295, partial [Arenibaculum sp.]|nr:hypothetical protein [Arenibaculum sp.]